MRILFDCRYTRFDRHDGISRYTAGLVTELGKLHPVTMLINDHRQLDLLPDLPWQLVSAPTSIREPFLARQLNRLQPGVVFSPMQTMGSWGRRYHLILTVHDLIYYRNPTPPRDLPAFVRVLWRLYHLSWWPQRMLLNRADGVVTVSATTRDLILEHRLTRRPITVIPNAAGALTAAPERRRTPATGRLVYMGSFMPYKNVDTLVRAAAELPEHELHLMSRVPAPERERLIALAPKARLVFHDGVTDEEYVDVLRSATALVSASLDEGFGIPLVEAMGLGLPVVVSDIPIFREIGGDAALYFDPTSAQALAAAVRRLDEPGEWADRSGKSLGQAARFTWHDSARKLLALLTGLASDGGRGAGTDTRPGIGTEAGTESAQPV
ncbi:glycosyltransferase family 1 protein [Cryobacterium sp. TMT1-21]|uniref:Glycosyltransferase family 1 protein n=1 Tax=Cryobacterium shii TaxID=1259235 RepID=A0AAQ2HFX0_9MICO|nr:MULTISPECIES: glycosyltransferase family 1 protein [Cryobacterium]TFC48588.1 glycosyltransferase family 1 protein [Cryobacterium shii]TFC81811.1 glycosyltransferase family 1 protein [Cryobacterium sp. TmT2-59]TFD08283.1 glycosyltransferase family 1 protein [Cryobacterium sp. TMT1-21]TFD20675.1 glycosyltransferase family 1 protein [Cryobacterium sp. TMT4-10]TFD24675.1 glycosyltransferase family 1 protein [Cryobacterium sp. TMT2-23]